ncbi:uncharacterized protein F5147DRAFT_656117 [Suillus discolor]|uniref:Uncharacterized protein n=1 Tax=Suillus discolor TaxID=1912936 RepID=A0A9P7EYC7_9AGAM|nr:uncharacterized protein F5147DRAFT_656117 [Suillus discolor]KAG2098225.1 hypothetical protein F5147DRAFT_656117 [Suillus discolor]
MSDQNQLGDLRSGPPPHIEISNEPNPAERPGRPHGKICWFLGKVTNGAIKNISCSNLRDSCSRDPVLPNVDREGVSSISNIEIQDAPPGVEQGADPSSALQEANDAAKGMNLLSGHVTSGVSAAKNASTDLEDAYKFRDTYLQPLRIFDSIIEKLGDAHWP